MVSAGISFSGYDEFILHNEKYGSLKTYDQIQEDILNDTVSLIRRKAPVDTGRLMESIAWFKVNSNKWKIVVNVEYAVYMEYGTVYFPVGTVNSPRMRTSASGKMCYHPFVRPSCWQMNKLYPEYVRRVLFTK